MKNTGRTMSMPGGLCLGVAISLIVTVFCAMLLSWLVTTERVEEMAIGYGAMVTLCVSAAIGCMIAWSKIRHRRLVITGLCAGIYYLVLMVIGLMFGGVREGLLASAVMIVLGGGISLIPAMTGKQSGGRRHHFSHFR